MVWFHIRKVHAVVITAAALVWLSASQKLTAANPAAAPNVTYVASGTFSSKPISGNDLFKLSGEPFSISVVVNAATPPTTHGAQWAKYTGLKMTGSVTSGLEPTPLVISSNLTSIELGIGNPSYDVFALFAPVNVIGIQINVVATLQLPPGTMAKPLVHPFASTALGLPDQMVYTDPATGSSTTLGIVSGTVVATIPGGADVPETPASVQLHAAGLQAITAHADGTTSVRSMAGAAALDLGIASEKVVLQFYASGVREGSEVRVQIAGQDVPVLYAGPGGHFAGLDQVSVEVPHSLAGMGRVEVALTVDGRTASPVHIQIQ